MAAPEVRGVVGRTRDILASRVRSSSLRGVARDVGMSPTGLKNFLAGSEPYSATRQKLECWLVRERGETAWADLDSARAALGLLVRELPLSRQERSAGRIAAVLREEYGEARLPLPAWLEEAE